MLRAVAEVGGLVHMIDRGELRLLGTQPCTADEVCNLLTKLYRGDTVSPLKLREADHDENIMFLDSGHQQQQLTALVTILRSQPVGPGRIEILFNLEHDDEDEQETFAEATPSLERMTQWVKVIDVLRTETDRPFLKHAGLIRIDDPRFDRYTQRLARLRAIRDYEYPMQIERA